MSGSSKNHIPNKTASYFQKTAIFNNSVSSNNQCCMICLFTPSHCLQIYVLRYLCIRVCQSTPSLRWKSTLSHGTYWTVSVYNEYNIQYYLPLCLVLLLPLLHSDVVNSHTTSYRRRSSVKYEAVPKLNVSLQFGG